MNKRTARSFAVLLGGLVLLCGLYTWAWRQPDADNVPAPFRRALEWNGKIWKKFYSPNVVVAPPPPAGRAPRVNGDIGLESELRDWKLEVDSVDGKKFFLSMNDLRRLPRTETSFNFKCIEGWSEVMSFGGVKFSDFLFAYGLSQDVPYVGLETPDGEYYVSLDMASMLHPQTLLAFEQNGKPLLPENGAPLRLAIPVKYGIKNLKRIGRIFFSRKRPPDYWAEQGYDWFSGL
jgi:DMSO/TMAO reductase YedYZ molybdopterin-dependent catalytic subunit